MQPYRHRVRWIIIAIGFACLLTGPLLRGRGDIFNVVVNSAVLVASSIVAATAANSMTRQPGPGYLFIGTTFLFVSVSAFLEVVLHAAWMTGSLGDLKLCEQLIMTAHLLAAGAFVQLPTVNTWSLRQARIRAICTGLASYALALLLNVGACGFPAGRLLSISAAPVYGVGIALAYAITLVRVILSAKMRRWLRPSMIVVGSCALVSSVLLLFEGQNWLVDLLGHYTYLAIFPLTYIYILGQANANEQLAIQQALDRYAAEQRDLMRRLSAAREDERRRLSQELHDDIGQMLGLIIGTLSPGRRQSQEAEMSIARARELATATLQAVRRMAREMRPAVLDDIGLIAALQAYANDYSAAHGIEVGFQVIGPADRRFSTEVETVVYRGVIEALTNVAKHASASHVSVVVDCQGTQLRVLIEDNGQGFDPESDASGIGIMGMSERLSLLGGSLAVESAPGAGTTVVLRLPIPAGPDDPYA